MPYRNTPPCPTPGCPNRSGQCEQHKPAPRQQRGYDADHDRKRSAYQRRMDAGEVFMCWRCSLSGTQHPVDPSNWDLGHYRGQHRGPECVRGNRGAPRRGG